MKEDITTEKSRTNREREAELRETRLKLEEAEETLRAIRNNEVDALVVDGPQGQQVFTLRGAEQPYRTLMETMSEGALTVAADGTILYCNQRFAEMLKTPLNRIIGSSFQEFMPSEDWRAFKAPLDACGKEGSRGEYHLVSLEGREVPVYISARALLLRDVESFCIVVTDLTEQRTLEQQIRQAQKMEALGTLSGGIAHDFNNILAAIIGFTELIRDHLPEGSQEARHVRRVLEAGLRGRELVKQMLAFSRKSAQEKKPLQLDGVVREAMKLLRASIPSTISVRVKADGASDLVFADPTQMQQVLMNLCTNAAHAMREKGGKLDVELSALRISERENTDGLKPGPYVRLIVRDTGVGIPPEIIDKIFDPFFTTKEVGEGTGLGLSVVHGIVKQHDGHISVTSEPGKGSAFTVYFPQIDEGPETDVAGDNEFPTGSERILFVDDEESIVEMSEDVLAELGYEVTSRINGRDALVLLKEDPSRFDLVITDQTMPEMTGLDLAKEVLAIRADIPVILCTGFSHVVDADKAKGAGIRAFAMKPLTKREIAKTIRKVLEE
jgi:PAS domain S-box-containing protein